MKRLFVVLAAVGLLATACGDSKDGDNKLSGSAFASGAVVDMALDAYQASASGSVSNTNWGFIRKLTIGDVTIPTPFNLIISGSTTGDIGPAVGVLTHFNWSPPSGAMKFTLFYPPSDQYRDYDGAVTAIQNAYNPTSPVVVEFAIYKYVSTATYKRNLYLGAGSFKYSRSTESVGKFTVPVVGKLTTAPAVAAATINLGGASAAGRSVTLTLAANRQLYGPSDGTSDVSTRTNWG